MIEEENQKNLAEPNPITSYFPGKRQNSNITAVGLMCIAFAILAGLIILTQTFVLLVALASTLSLAAYLLVSLKRQKKMPPRKKMQAPFPILFGLLLLPIVAASFYSLEDFNTRSIYSIVVAFGMTL